jgi:hypothetical protein
VTKYISIQFFKCGVNRCHVALSFDPLKKGDTRQFFKKQIALIHRLITHAGIENDCKNIQSF